MKTNDYKVEYEVQIKSEYLSQSAFYVDVREDHILPCGDIESKYVESFAFRDDFKGNMPTAWEKAEAKWNDLGKKYEDKMRRENGGLIDYQNWIDGTSKIVEILINDGEFHLPSD